MERLMQFLAEVVGWLSEGEGLALYYEASEVRPGEVIVEIGSFQGRSTVCMAEAVRVKGSGVPVYAVDPHSGSSEHRVGGVIVNTYPQFWANLERFGLAQYVRPLVMTSVEAAPQVNEPVGLLFIDGAHELKAVFTDFRLWWPKISLGGLVAFHDVMNRQFWGPWLVSSLALLICRCRHPAWTDNTVSFEKVASVTWREWWQKCRFVGWLTWIKLTSSLRVKLALRTRWAALTRAKWRSRTI